MAISLRSRDSVQKSDAVSQFLDKIITKGTDAARERDRGVLQKASQRSEYEQFMEKEQWVRMRAEREKDLVLMFAEDNVKIFKRHPERDVRSRLRSQATRDQLTKHDAVDTSGLLPVKLERGVVKALTSEYVPFSQEERDKLEARRAEIIARRQQAMLATTYQSGTLAAQNAAQQAHLLAVAQGQTIAQLTDLGITVPKSDLRLGSEPTQIPMKAWAAWMKTHSTQPQQQSPEKDKSPQGEGRSPTKKGRRHRRRHHRINCKFHPFSTNPDMKRLIAQVTFPQQEVRKSAVRLQLAVNGAPNGYSEHTVHVEEYFPRPVLCPPRRGSAFGTGISSNGSFTLSRSGPKSVGFAVAEEVSSEPSSPDEESISFVSASEHSRVLDSQTTHQHRPNSRQRQSGTSDTFVLTQSVADGEHSVTSTSQAHLDLAPFMRPPRPHSVAGTYVDCDCTDRSTDDENPCFGLGRPPITSSKTHGRKEDPEKGESDDEGKKDDKGADGTEKKKKKKKSADSSSNLLMGSATRADQRLALWRRDFEMTSVHAQSCLSSILAEREELRRFILEDRQHLDLVTSEAEIAAEEFRVARHHRCTTPSRGSMWAPVFAAIGDGSRRVAGLVAAFSDLLEQCREVQFPCTSWEVQLLEGIRERCIKAAEAHISPARSRSSTPPGGRRTPSASSRPQSQLSTSSASTAKQRLAPPGRQHGSKSVVGSAAAASSSSSTSSVFLKNSSAVSANSPVAASGAPASSGLTEQEQFQSLAFSSSLFFEIMDQHGAKLLRHSEGTLVSETLRKMCFVPSKAFATYLYAKESSWTGMCQAAKQLLKHHSGQAGGAK
jgi:hypothetical protein